MISGAFKEWLQQKGIDYTDYTLMLDDARFELNASYMRENIELNKRYKIKDLEKKFSSICVEMKEIKEKNNQIVSGVLVNIFPNSYMTEKRYWELMLEGDWNTQIVGIA